MGPDATRRVDRLAASSAAGSDTVMTATAGEWRRVEVCMATALSLELTGNGLDPEILLSLRYPRLDLYQELGMQFGRPFLNRVKITLSLVKY
jgi:hypothetical protein